MCACLCVYAFGQFLYLFIILSCRRKREAWVVSFYVKSLWGKTLLFYTMQRVWLHAKKSRARDRDRMKTQRALTGVVHILTRVSTLVCLHHFNNKGTPTLKLIIVFLYIIP